MQKLDLAGLEQVLASKQGASIVSIVAETDPKARKKDDAGNPNPFVGLRKVARVNGIINWHYENAVNNQRCREETPTDNEGNIIPFEAAHRQWGYRETTPDGKLTPFVFNPKTGERYLELKVQRSLEYQYVDANGNVIPAELVNPFLPQRKEGARQQVENPVILRDYKLSNIKQLQMGGELFVVE